MRKFLRLFATMAILCSLFLSAKSQTTLLKGIVKNAETGEGIPAVSVNIKGTERGVYSKANGEYEINVSLPITIVFSSIGYETQEMTFTDASFKTISLTTKSDLGQEVVVAATRTSERLIESPVTVDRISSIQIKNTAAPTFYESLANIKGVDLTTSSLTFRTISTRGFNGSGNLRFNQLVDGMDNQAPALNFSVGNVVGMTEMDVDNAELLSGASSALYGSGGMNGTLLLTSKNPFKYQGLSVNIKQGVMHIADAESKAKPYYDWAMRWGQKIGEKFAYKIAASYTKAEDWIANDTRNLSRNNIISSLKPGNRVSDPNYDGVNVFGDEASAAMAGIAQAYQLQTRNGILASNRRGVRYYKCAECRLTG